MPPGSISTPGRSNRTVWAAGSSMNVPVAHLGQRRRDFRLVGQAAGPLVEPPDLHQRSHRDIERPLALPAVLHARRKQLEQLRRNLDRLVGRVPVDLAPLAVRA